MSPRTACVAFLAVVVAACGSSAATSPPDAGAHPIPPTGPCQSIAALSLLGTWQTTEIGPGGPNGTTPTPITVTMVFCGTETTGILTTREDGPGSPGPGCHLVSKGDTAWVWKGAGQPLIEYPIGAPNFTDVSGCLNQSQNYHLDYNDGNYCNSCDTCKQCEQPMEVVQLTATQLVLKAIDIYGPDSGIPPASPETWTRK